MGLSGFQIRPVSGPEVADLEGLSGPLIQNPSKMAGRFAPHHFGWVLKRFRAVLEPQSQRFPVQKPAGFENQTIPCPDLPNA